MLGPSCWRLGLSKETHNAWATLIRKVEEEDVDLNRNIALVLIKLTFDYDPNYKIRDQFPLNVISQFGDLRIMSTMLRSESNVVLAQIGTPIVKFIKEKNMDETMSNSDIEGWTPIHNAARMGHIELLKVLTDCTGHGNARDAKGFTPIIYAAKNGQTECLKVLLRCTANPNTPCGEYGWMPIHFAAEKG